MTLSGRPLLDNGVDAALFVGRERELDTLAAALAQHLNVLVTGAAGSGKTSVLHALRHRARTRADWPAAGVWDIHYVRVEHALDTRGALVAITAALTDDVSTADVSTADVSAADVSTADPLSVLRPRWSRTGDKGEDQIRNTVIMVDDINGLIGHELFGRLRDELWELDLIWIVAVRDTDAATLTLPPADAFFDTRVDIGPMSDGDAVDMVGRRTRGRAGAWARPVNGAVGGNPRRVLDIARDVTTSGGSLNGVEPLLDAITARQQAIARLGRPEMMLAAELDKLGTAAASDPRLLGALGWTRPRAVQVFARLEQAGLVISEQVRGDRGRPRRMYRMTPPEQFPTGRAVAEATR